MSATKSQAEITHLLSAISQGERSSVDELLPHVYREMRALAGSFMRRERQGHSLQPTELVHEAYLRLVDQTRVDWRSRTHFFAVAAQAMRRILVDHARRQTTAKRGGGKVTTSLDDGQPLSPRPRATSFRFGETYAFDASGVMLSESRFVDRLGWMAVRT